MAFVRFNRNSAVNFGSGPVRLVKGETMEADDGYAERWAKSGLATVVDAPAKGGKPVPPVAPAPMPGGSPTGGAGA